MMMLLAPLCNEFDVVAPAACAKHQSGQQPPTGTSYQNDIQTVKPFRNEATANRGKSSISNSQPIIL